MLNFLIKNLLFEVFVLFTVIASISAKCYWAIPIFILSIILVYVIPGIAIQKLCKTLDYDDYNKVLLSSFAVGYTFSLILYLSCLILGVQQYVMVPSIIIVVLSFLYIRKDLYSLYHLQAHNTGFLAIVLAMTYILAYVGYQLNYLSPEVAEMQDIYPDYAFHFRNAVSGTKSYPLPDLSVMGNYLYYHYFPGIGLSYLKYLTGIELFDLCFTYSYVINLVLLIGSLYIIIPVFVRNVFLIKVAMFLILFTTSWETMLVTTYVSSVYFNSIAFTEGFALSIFSYYFFRKSQSINGQVASWFLALLIFIGAIGCKAPVAMIVMIGILASLGVDGMKKKLYTRNVLIGTLYVFVFCTVMLLFVWNVNPLFKITPHGNVVLSFLTVFRTGFYVFLMPLVKIFPNCPLQSFVYFCIYILVNSFIIIVWSVVVLRHRNYIKWSNLDYGPLAIFFSGYFLFLFINQGGFSQVYFYFATIPFGIIFILSIIDVFKLPLKSCEKWSLRIVTICGFVFFIYAVRCHIVSNKIFEDRSFNEIKGNTLNKEEFTALRWVRDNTDENAVLLSNKIKAKEFGRRSYVVSAFTERQLFLEGYEYSVSPSDPIIADRRAHILNMFENNKDESAYFKKKGVTHLVLFKNLMDKDTKIHGNVIYENSAVVVTKL